MPLRAASIVAAAGLLALAVAIVVAGLDSERRTLGTNGVRPLVFVGPLGEGETLCQTAETVPANAAGVWLRIGTNGAATPRLSLAVDGRRSSLAPGWAEGDVIVPIEPAARERANVRLCVSNDGPADVLIAGENSGPPLNATVGDMALGGRVRVEYHAAHETSWWGHLGAVAERMSIVRGFGPGTLALPLILVLALVVVGGSVALVLREARE